MRKRRFLIVLGSIGIFLCASWLVLYAVNYKIGSNDNKQTLYAIEDTVLDWKEGVPVGIKTLPHISYKARETELEVTAGTFSNPISESLCVSLLTNLQIDDAYIENVGRFRSYYFSLKEFGRNKFALAGKCSENMVVTITFTK